MSDGIPKEARLLAAILLECPSFSTPEKRADRLQDLGEKFSQKVAIPTEAMDACYQIVVACWQTEKYSEAPEAQLPLSRIVDLVRDWEADKPRLIKRVEEAANALRQRRRELQAEAAPQRSDPPGASGQKKLALLIGISRYQNGGVADQPLAADQFTHLKFAAKDAQDLYAFLQQDPSCELEPLLLDEGASRRDILRALDRLRRRCARAPEPKPIVMIYFSGHGACSDRRNYLVPHDGERNELFATALWSKTLDSALAEIETPKVVLFLDACRTGAIGVEGVKDAGLLQVDPASLVGDPAYQQRHVIASCLATQQSHEVDGNGIFTHHLLSLMRLEQPDVFEGEAIDLWDLTRVLIGKVQEDPQLKFGAAQEPFANFQSSTGIVLAINTARRQQRLERESRYLEAVAEEIRRIDQPQGERIVGALQVVVQGGGTPPARLKEFFQYFRQGAAGWSVGDADYVSEDGKALVLRFKNARVAADGQRDDSRPQSSPRIDETRSGSRSAPAPTAGKASPGQVDAFASASAPATATLPPSAAVPPPLSAGSSQQAAPAERRKLSTDDCKFVREPIWNKLYLDVAPRLNDLLASPDGVSEEKIIDWLLETRPGKPDAQAQWDAAKESILGRFQERWPYAEPIRLQSALSVRTAGANG